MSNLECTWKGPVAIDFCRSLSFFLSVTEIWIFKVIRHFAPLTLFQYAIIDYRIQGLETLKITGFIRISPFLKLCTLARALL